MEGKTIGIVAVVIIVLGGGWFLLSGTPVEAPSTTTETTGTTGTTQNPVTTTTTTSTTTTSFSTNGVTVVYTDQGFSPKNITVPDGTSVYFVNQSSKSMWVASAAHPAHTVYDGTSLSQHCAAGYRGTDDSAPFDQCSSGTNYGFGFYKVGTWKYHNHNSAGDTGTITVTATASSVIER